MKKRILVFIVFILMNSFGISAQPAVQWQKSLGGSNMDGANAICATSDGGSCVAGMTFSNNWDVDGNNGAEDCWIVKLDYAGNIQWQKPLGGTGFDYANSIQQTSDGGYIIAAVSSSSNGDATFNNGLDDYWIIKLNNNGNIIWQKSFGGSAADEAFSIKQTADNGFIVAGHTTSVNGDVSNNHGHSDCWIIKLSDNGNLEWEKTYGGTGYESPGAILQTADNGYIFAGTTTSIDGDVSNNKGQNDFWIVKLTNTGNIEWEKTYGGSNTDEANAIRQTPDGGYIVAGRTFSEDGDIVGHRGGLDFWVIKLSNNGSMEWQRSLGGTDHEGAKSIELTDDDGFIITGWSTSSDIDVTKNSGIDDYWIIKLNSNGITEWTKILGGSESDGSKEIAKTTDGGYVIAGGSSSNNGDVTKNRGDYDFWVVKLEGSQVGIKQQDIDQELVVYPNPTNDNLNIHLKKNISIGTVQIVDESGKQIMQDQNPGNIIHISGLKEGSYLLKMTDIKGKVLSSKFIKR